MGGLLNYFFDEKYNKWGKSKNKKEHKKKAPKKIENPPAQIELPHRHEEEVPIKDTKGNAIIKESADDMNMPNERQTRQPNGWDPLETEETNRH